MSVNNQNSIQKTLTASDEIAVTKPKCDSRLYDPHLFNLVFKSTPGKIYLARLKKVSEHNNSQTFTIKFELFERELNRTKCAKDIFDCFSTFAEGHTQNVGFRFFSSICRLI